MKFNKTEINLCEQIAKKHRKNLKIGMYVWRKFCKTIQLIYRLDKEDKEIYTVILRGKKLNHLYWNNLKGGWLTPLWTISECLEFLRGNPRIQIVEIVWDILKFKANVSIRPCGTHNGNTVLEACLKAVLAVLEETK